MAVHRLASQLADWISRGTDGLRSVARWWVDELLGTIPNGLANWLTEKGGRSLILAPTDGAVALHLMTDTRRMLASAEMQQADYSPESINAFLAGHGARGNRVSVGIRMPADAVFVRNLLFPTEVRRSLSSILVQDLLARTPFRLDDIYHGHTATRIADKIAVCQWIVHRKHVSAAAAAVGVDPDDVAFLEAETPDSGKLLPAIKLRDGSLDGPRWVSRTALALTVTALLLTCLLGGLRHSHQQRLLDALQADIATAKAKAQQTVGAMTQVQREHALLGRIRQKKAFEPGLLGVWEETTHILPDHSWLAELRLSETGESRHIVLTGYSRGAAALVSLIDQSELFSEAALVAPISVDPTEDRERFAIQASVKKPQANRTALK